jgi:hypothetical protein
MTDYQPIPIRIVMDDAPPKDMPEKKTLLSDFIKVYDNVLPNELCDELIGLLSTERKYRHDNDYLRRDEVSLIHFHEPFQKVKSYIYTTYQRYKQDIGSCAANLHLANTYEMPVVVSYKPSEDKKEVFHDHADAWHTDSTSRQVSTIMYLSDVREGGETQFAFDNISIRPVKGRVLFFPSNFLFQHQGKAPISDIKYACVSWIHFDGPTTYATAKF